MAEDWTLLWPPGNCVACGMKPVPQKTGEDESFLPMCGDCRSPRSWPVIGSLHVIVQAKLDTA